MNRFIWVLFILLNSIAFNAKSQAPDLSKITNKNDKVNAWLGYCEFLKSHSGWNGTSTNQVTQSLSLAALEGLKLIPKGDAENRARFYAYAAQGYYFTNPMKADSVAYYYYQSLLEAKKARSALLMINAATAMMHINFEFGEKNSVDSFKNILQSIIDTASDKIALAKGYGALGSYYQQKSYYATAQNFFIKSIEFQKAQIDTTHNPELIKEYLGECYTIAQLYLESGHPDKSLNMLREGQRFKGISELLDMRYTGLYIQAFTKNGDIDSALKYLQNTIGPLEERFKNSNTVPFETIISNASVAEFYLDRKLYEKALPYVNKASSLAEKSEEPLFKYKGEQLKARYFSETGHPEKAIVLLSSALPVSIQFSKEDYTEELKYMALSQKAAGNLPEAVKYYSQYANELDSLTKEKMSTNFADQETRYETSQKEQRITALNNQNRLNVLELKNASRTRQLLIIGLFALGIISLLLYFIYRNREKLNKILNGRNTELDALNNQLATANETKAKLFGIIGHDLRSPVSRIVQMLKIQKEKPELLDENSKKHHEENLKNASENVLETMEDLLLWSKSQMQHFKPEMRNILITEVVEKESSFLKEHADSKNILIQNEIPKVFSLKTDESFLEIIIRNLLQNAVKYSSDGTTISIASEFNRITINNKIADVNLENIKEVFQNKSVNSKNSGLGLQIAKDLASAIGAKIVFDLKENNNLESAIVWENS